MRMQSMDLLKFLAIFLVLWGHAEQYLLSCDYAERAVYRHIYSFHMPLFMMISGFFFAMTIKPRVMKNIVGKTRQLLLPAACWALLFALPSAVSHGNIPSLGSIENGLRYGFWFLKSAFACNILGLLPFLVLRKHFWTASVITLFISQALFKIPVLNLPTMYPAFLLGGIIYRYHDRFIAHTRWIIPLCGFVWIVCNMFLDAEAYRTMKGSSELLVNHTLLEIAGWKLYMYLMGLCGAVAFMALFEVIFSTPRQGRFYGVAADWGKMTLGIYILQGYFLETFLAHYVKFDGVSDIVFDFVISPLTALGVMIVCVGIIRIIRLNGYASFFLLGTKWPRRASTQSQH